MNAKTLANRRDFLSLVAGTSLAGLSRVDAASVPPAADGDYLFSPGPIYLGTATLGPCSRTVVEATTKAWYELETNPTAMGYGNGDTLAAAERTR